MGNISQITENKNIYIKKVFDIIEDSVWIKEDYLKEKKWKVILRESNSHFNEEIAEKISKAMHTLGYKEIYGVQCENWDKERLSVYKLSTDTRTLLKFDRDVAALYKYAFIPEDVSFIIICSIVEFLIFAGAENFVEAASGYYLKEYKEKFNLLIEEYRSLPFDQEYLRQVAAYYEQFNEML